MSVIDFPGARRPPGGGDQPPLQLDDFRYWGPRLQSTLARARDMIREMVELEELYDREVAAETADAILMNFASLVTDAIVDVAETGL